MAKEFAWSFSKIKNFETCPKKYYEVDVQKAYSEGRSEQLDWGDRVHHAMHAALGKGEPLPGEMAPFQKWVDKFSAGPGRLLVEQKYAIDKTFQPVAYFAPTVWFRGIGDVVRVDGPVGLIGDWKTGQPKPDSVQLALTAQCLFSHYKELRRVRTMFIWLQDGSDTTEDYDRSDMVNVWRKLLPRVDALENAHKTLSFPPKPSGLCKRYCPVASCPYWKKGSL